MRLDLRFAELINHHLPWSNNPYITALNNLNQSPGLLAADPPVLLHAIVLAAHHPLLVLLDLLLPGVLLAVPRVRLLLERKIKRR